jgi:hypothetical protein
VTKKIDVKRAPLSTEGEAVEVFAIDSPARPGHTPQKGDRDWTLQFPLHDGKRLKLHVGDETLNTFKAFVLASAADDVVANILDGDVRPTDLIGIPKPKGH